MKAFTKIVFRQVRNSLSRYLSIFAIIALGVGFFAGVRATAPDGRLWYQLYVMKDREISYGLVDRAAAAGFDTLLFTVDTPIAGNRMRDARNGFSIPPQLTARTILDAIPRPWWWAAM